LISNKLSGPLGRSEGAGKTGVVKFGGLGGGQ